MCSTEDQASSHQGVTNQATTNGKEERTDHSEEAADAGVKTLNLVYQADGVYHLKKLMSLQATSSKPFVSFAWPTVPKPS